MNTEIENMLERALDDDALAFQLLVKYKINTVFAGNRFAVKRGRIPFDICCVGGPDLAPEIRWCIVDEVREYLENRDEDDDEDVS